MSCSLHRTCNCQTALPSKRSTMASECREGEDCPPCPIDTHPTSFSRLPSFNDFTQHSLLPIPSQQMHRVSILTPSSTVQASNHRMNTATNTTYESDRIRFFSLNVSTSNTSTTTERTRLPNEDQAAASAATILAGCRRRSARIFCKHIHCESQAQSGGLCKTHGGGRRCTYDGCGKSSQSMGRCRKHGGGKLCSFEGCTRGPQRGGLCHIVSST